MQPKILPALALAAAVFVVAPAAANATVKPALDTNTLTLTGDAQPDNITLTVNGGGKLVHSFGVANGLQSVTDFDPDPAHITELNADGSIKVVVNAGDGNDNINLSVPDLADSVINGEAGDDIIVGTDNLDTIDGGLGNDRISGFKNPIGTNEPINGGDGNDVMIWNNGDGNDINEGGNGVDESLVTAGTADDDMTVNQNGARTLFHRNNAAFDVDMNQVEKLSITSFSGNDKLATGAGVPLVMNVDAGSGDDNITTGDGADLILGGDGNDTLNSGNGGDRIVGDRGGDTMNGGAGDDTTVWNNGDGSDVMNGDAGTDRVEVNLSAGTDVSTLKNEAGRVRYDRTNVGPFNLSMATVETFELNSLGGDDTLTTAGDVNLPIVADMGAGNDSFQGGAGNDSFDGGDGDDSFLLREGGADFARGGNGTDKATLDLQDAVAVDVESIDRPVVTPAPGPVPAGAATIAKSATVKKGVASLKLSCPAGTSGCSGNVTLVTAGKVKLGRVSAQLVLASTKYTLKAGETKTIKVKLTNNAAKLAKKKKLASSARVASGAAGEKSIKVTLSFK